MRKLLYLFALIVLTLPASAATDYRPFVITVRDAATGLGIPLAQLRTTNKIVLYTDRQGQAAIYEPGLMGEEVYFHVSHPKFQKAADGFGNRGQAFRLTEGGSGEIRLERVETEPSKRDLTPAQQYALRQPAFVPAPGTVEPFVIRVTDQATGRGVPLVCLRADAGPEFVTDSAGVVALVEPALLGRRVRFEVFSHGYKSPESAVIQTAPGGEVRIAIERINIAERLYRITGGGIYHYSTLAGLEVPLKRPNLCGRVTGQDTVAMTRYKGRYQWLWGDTDRPAYPLGNFKTSGATSPLPGAGVLKPGEGIDLTYHVDAAGFSRQMFPRDDAGLVWMGTMNTVDDDGTERMVASYAAMRGSAAEVFERGMAIYDDAADAWRTLVVFTEQHRLPLSGHAYKHSDGRIYVTQPYPAIRFDATLAGVSEPVKYEGFTCLAPGTTFEGENTKVERDAEGKLVWAWKTNTGILNDDQWQKLADAKIVTIDETPNRFRDIETGEHVSIHGGSVAYNAYRDRWVMIFLQAWGKPSFLGEVWYAEAPAPEGPWNRAIRIITHDNYTFYNVQHHPEFDEDGGRRIYLEGTYVTTYSGNPNPTPRYDYNQIMYRMDLTDPRIEAYGSK